jgi:hypothetical protein
MTALVQRSVAVIVVAAVCAWLLGSTISWQTGAVPEPVGPSGAGKSRPDRANIGASARPTGGPDHRLGVQLSAHHGAAPKPALAVMDRLQEAGARWVRVDVGWATLQPTGPGAFDQWYVDLLDAVLAGARERDLKVIVSLWLTPGWASETGSLYAPPRNETDYASAIGRAARRWGEDVAAWEVWNEPNFTSFFEGADPAVYTRLLCAAYPAVKKYDDSPVLFGGLMYNDDAWLAEAYRAGAKRCFDVLATHPYVGPSDASPDTPSVGAVWRLTHTPAVRAVMDEWGDKDKRIWITELGWSSGPDNEGNPWDRSVSPRRQARFLRQAVELIRSDYPYVGPIIWYRDVDGPTDGYQDGFGLLHPDLSPKPSMRAFESAVRGK